MLNVIRRGRVVQGILLGAVLGLIVPCLLSQTTISTGSIVGTVADPQGAVVPNAKVTITNKATAHAITTQTTSAGTYTSGALTPGQYVVRVAASGFKTVEEAIVVEVGVTSSGNVKLQLGATGQVVEVQATDLQVNTEQATVQGVLSPVQIENLPINGRNFLDLAQLEPGVQIQDGGNFDPTKKGFSSISFGGRFGRTARIEIDGVDSSDETVGTVTQDIPQGAISEFQLGQSMLDLSTELTSSGSVNVVTKSGTNSYHGSGYYAFRDQILNADLPGASADYFQRNQFGGNFGGAIIKSKLFFFVDAERTKQDQGLPVLAAPPFEGSTGVLPTPFREAEGIAKMDWQINQNYHLFYRFSYDQNSDTTPFEPIAYQPLNNTTHTRDHVVGFDFTTGNFTHSVRFGYMKFFNHIASGTNSSTPFNTSSPLELSIGPDPNCLNTSGVVPDLFCSGQGLLAPQSTPQSDHQLKYDGSHVIGAHFIRYGGGWNHIQGGGFAGFLADGPAVNATTSECAGFANCVQSNPLTYPTNFVLLGNGSGYSTEKPSFGFPFGGLGPDNRISWYVGDSWKIRQNFTLDYGLRYARDTGRTDSDLAPIPQLAAFNNQFYSGLQNRVNNPNLNFAPQLGFAWDLASNGKTVIRGGIGLFYENSIWNNVLFDRPGRLTTGSFLGFQPACLGGGAQTFTLPGTTTVINPAAYSFNGTTVNVCNAPIGSVEAPIYAMQQQYQAAAASVGSGPNAGFVGNTLSDTGPYGTGTNLFAPDYKSARSVQINIGIQRELHPGTILTADYLRNVSTRTLLGVDTNHVGDTRFVNVAAANAAIANTLAACGQTTIEGAILNGTCPGNALTPNAHPATIVDFAGNGLDSGYSLCGGGPCPNAAFGGINNGATGGNQMLFPIGRSVFNALQLSLKQDVHNPFRGVRYMNLQVSYQLSRYVSQAADGDFVNSAWNYANPGQYLGPNGLDRTHQISFGGVMDLPANFRLSIIGHFYSGLPTTLTFNPTGLPGGMFVTGVNGDGTGDGYSTNGTNGPVGSILPGTNLGAYGRGINGGNINGAIGRYNQNYAGTPTPAGKVLINQFGFTQQELTQLGAVMPVVNPAPADQANNGWLRDFDTTFGWTYKTKEHLTLEPTVSFFNLMNFANFDPAKFQLSGVLSEAAQPGLPGSVSAPGTVTGTPGQQPNSQRVGLGSGVFGLGAPRVLEFALKLNF